MSLDAHDIPGRAVIDVAGRLIGRVERLVVDGESWAIASLELKLSRASAQALGMRWSFLRAARLQVPTGLVLGAGDVIVLRAQMDELQALVPEQEEPRFAARLSSVETAA